MVLPQEDCALFYRLFFALLDYINEHYHVVDMPKMSGADSVDCTLSRQVANYVWARTNLIDEYLAQATDLSPEDAETVHSWKRCVTGRFFVERHLKRGTAMIAENDEVYMVSGIVSDWEDMLPPLPAMVKTTLLPFKGRIIYDSVFESFPIIFGGGIKKMLKETYMDAKKGGHIHFTL